MPFAPSSFLLLVVRLQENLASNFLTSACLLAIKHAETKRITSCLCDLKGPGWGILRVAPGVTGGVGVSLERNRLLYVS